MCSVLHCSDKAARMLIPKFWFSGASYQHTNTHSCKDVEQFEFFPSARLDSWVSLLGSPDPVTCSTQTLCRYGFMLISPPTSPAITIPMFTVIIGPDGHFLFFLWNVLILMFPTYPPPVLSWKPALISWGLLIHSEPRRVVCLGCSSGHHCCAELIFTYLVPLRLCGLPGVFFSPCL